MEWSRFRTVGIDLMIVGVLVLVLSSGFALYNACPNPGVCHTEVDWGTLSPSIALIAAGVVVFVMARRQKRGAP